jgi:hypothetical protein
MACAPRRSRLVSSWRLQLCPPSPAQGFVVPNPKKLGAVTAIYSGLDFTKTGMNEIVVGREDGNLEVRRKGKETFVS